MNPIYVLGGIELAKKVIDNWMNNAKEGAKDLGRSGSLIAYTSAGRVEPIVLIDADCLYLDALGDVQQSLLSIFAGYYLQAIALSTQVGKVSVMDTLDKLNPSRSPVTNAGYLIASESYKDCLPTFEKKIALEDAGTNEDDSQKIQFGKDTYATLKELSNLSVGKMISVDITDGKNHASIPIAIRLIASSVPTNELVHILSVDSEDKSLKERWHSYKAGRLELIRDLILCQDLVDAHRKNLMNDKDGIYSNLAKRSANNFVSAIVSGKPSVGSVSNIVVMSDTTAEQLEIKLNGKLSHFETREKMFASTAIMLLAVIDKAWERVTIYSNGIHMATEISAKDMRAANKGSGPDIGALLNAYRMGNAPSL